ncbi:MAG: mannonate dehydratase [Alphaproteobacteria bacterium]|nr:mannonate dehydratase [Alphaproteobacteria bacterium]
MATNRRTMIHTLAGALLAGSAVPAFAQQGPNAPYNPHPARRLGMAQESADTPKLTIYMNDALNDQEAIRIKQIGIDWVDLSNVPAQPWGVDYLKPRVDALKKHDMHIGILMIRWAYKGSVDPDMDQIVRGGPRRDAEIDKIKQTIVNCGKLGIPVVEWNFYNHRATDGYKDIPGRGGAIYEDFNYQRMKNMAPPPGEPPQNYEDTWKHLEYFLKAVVPVAEKNNVVLSVHPNDPPAPMSRGSAQVLNSFSDWKRLVETVNSPSNCMTWDCGVTRELGEDPVTVGNWLASRNRIGQVHFRNVVMRKPREDYTEVFPDTGDNDMYEVMKLLVRNNYKRLIFPEHPRGLDIDKLLPKGTNPTASWAYNVAYCRAMLQIALRELRGL